MSSFLVTVQRVYIHTIRPSWSNVSCVFVSPFNSIIQLELNSAALNLLGRKGYFSVVFCLSWEQDLLRRCLNEISPANHSAEEYVCSFHLLLWDQYFVKLYENFAATMTSIDKTIYQHQMYVSF